MLDVLLEGGPVDEVGQRVVTVAVPDRLAEAVLGSIARWAFDACGVGWWSQMVAVGYEVLPPPGDDPLGSLFTQGFQLRLYVPLVTGVVLCVVLAVVFDGLIIWLNKLLTPWRQRTVTS